jgi:purine-nucleoside phosphorylase
MQEIAFPIRIFAFLGVEALIITCSAGAINLKFKPGDVALITDHINLSFESPLRGPNSGLLGARFPTMKHCYSPYLIDIARKVSAEIGFKLQEGVYAYMPGPQFETDAEINMLNIFGASMVGMSIIPEAIVAVQSGMDVLGIACITNAAGEYGEATFHNEVLESASNLEKNFKALVLDTINKIEIETEG